MSPLGISTDEFTIPMPEFWINYELGRRVLQCIESRIANRYAQRPVGLLIVADPNNGKSFILEKAKRDLTPRLWIPHHDGVQIPIVSILAPVKANLSLFYQALGTALQIPNADRMKVDRLFARLRRAFIDAGVCAIFVDELQNLVAGTSSDCLAILDQLRDFSTELHIPIIAAGTTRAHQATRSEEQYRSRFPAIHLPKWPLDHQYVGLLRALEGGFGFPPGSLSTPEIGKLLWTHSRGTIGGTASVAWEAHLECCRNGGSTITIEHINRAGFSDLPWVHTV